MQEQPVPGRAGRPTAAAQSLAKLSVDFPIDAKPSRTVDTYELKDDIVLLNSTRS